MALPRAVAGGKRPAARIQWMTEDGEPLDLTDAVLTGKIAAVGTGETRELDGVLSVVDGSAGLFAWNYGDGDVAEAGDFIVQFTAAFGADPTPARTFKADWRVEDSL